MFITFILRLGAVSNAISISAAEICLGILMVAAIVKIYKTRDYSIFKKGFFIFLMLMILAEAISTFAGIDPERSMKRFFGFWVMFYLPVIYVVFEGKNRMAYMMSVFAGAAVASVYGIWEFFFKHMERADGFYSHSLTYGNVLAMICVAAVGIILFRAYESKRDFYITMMSFILCFAALIFSGSRGPILSLFVAMFALFVYRFRWKGFIAGAVAVVILAGLITQVPEVEKRFTKALHSASNSRSSIGTRIVLWEASSKAIMVRPLFGYGKGNFKSVVSKYINVPTASRAHAHNSYIQYTFLHGFFGLFALLGFFSALIYEIARRMRSGPFVKTAFFILIVFLLEGLTENNLTDSEVVLTCYSMIGMMLAPGRPSIRNLVGQSPDELS